MSLFAYHTRLALKSLRRDPGLSTTIVVVMGVAGVIFCTAIMHYVRLYGPRAPLAPALHQLAGLAVGALWLGTILATLIPALRAARVPPSVAGRSL